MHINKLIDHTFLRTDATISDIRQLCKDAIEHDFVSVCVNPVYVPFAVEYLQDYETKVGTTVGFPIGAVSPEMKYAETRFVIHQGAEEVDMVINVGALKDGNLDLIKRETGQVVEAADGNCVKIIIETCLLTNEEKIIVCNIAKTLGAHFVKTSTGFSIKGATVEDVRLMRKTVGKEMGVKASGGIKTLSDLNTMVTAGANRIGTTSAIAILSELKSE